ncbi:hypothetical protein BH11PSE11_BH11PSE11_03440 [soil metagenome]
MNNRAYLHEEDFRQPRYLDRDRRRTTWEPCLELAGHCGDELEVLEKLPDTVFAFPKQRKEPLIDAAHVRAAIARFDQVEGVTDEDRRLATENIIIAARHYGIDIV